MRDNLFVRTPIRHRLQRHIDSGSLSVFFGLRIAGLDLGGACFLVLSNEDLVRI